jgi:hypothetical protein
MPLPCELCSDDEDEVPTPSGQDGHGSGVEAAPARATRRQPEPAPNQPPAKRQRRGTQQHAAAPQQPAPANQQHAEADATPVAAGRSRAAARGLAATMRAVANEGMPAQRTSSRRVAAAGVALAVQAAAADVQTDSSDDSEEVGAILLGMAAGAASNPAEAGEEAESAEMRPELAAARSLAAAAGIRNRERINSQHKPRGEPKDFPAGHPVLLALPAALHRGLQDQKLVCRVVKVDKRGLFTLRCNAGLLAGTFQPGELADGAVCEGDLNFSGTNQQGVPKVALAAAVAAAAAERRNGRPAAPRCGCKTECGPRCPCRKANVVCSRECKCKARKGHTCENYH